MSHSVILNAEPIKSVKEVNGKYIASFCIGSVKDKDTEKYKGGLWVQMWFDTQVNAWDKVTLSEGYFKVTQYNGKPQVTLYPSKDSTLVVEPNKPKVYDEGPFFEEPF